jgi:molybdopterin-guanine dinucleotide biosynthesis adapter protein
MKIFAFVGASESGKTRLIARLVPELKRRGWAVAVVKHCGHGFDFGGPDKDSSKFLAAGAEGVALAGPDRTAVIRDNRVVRNNRVGPRSPRSGLGALARKEFAGADIVLVEGGKSDRALRKIEVLRSGIPDGLRTPPAELAAIVADRPVAGAAVPLFSPERVGEIADWLTATKNSGRTRAARRPRRP